MKKENLLEKIRKGVILSGLSLFLVSGIGFSQTYSPPSRYPSIEESKKNTKQNDTRGWYALGIYAGLITMYGGIRSEIPGIKKKREESSEEREESSEKN